MKQNKRINAYNDLQEILTLMEKGLETQDPTFLPNIKSFVLENIINKEDCDKNIRTSLDKEFKDKNIEEKYYLLLNKYLDKFLDCETYFYLSHLKTRQLNQKSIDLNNMLELRKKIIRLENIVDRFLNEKHK